ncbi:hypothetical protein M407DRAFT_221262 [Tulasnella calospora MUT 4182]|uniref:Uncharacterized protein n=1 Tax=Tulasnella calospora MUT 4182 TaxID=1051891 RepID=A0A0C3KFB5_9AGAM|nr:hypothetical protein M407DRAFT_221262 [Tulasnella calospora MUT 4182]
MMLQRRFSESGTHPLESARSGLQAAVSIWGAGLDCWEGRRRSLLSKFGLMVAGSSGVGRVMGLSSASESDSDCKATHKAEDFNDAVGASPQLEPHYLVAAGKSPGDGSAILLPPPQRGLSSQQISSCLVVRYKEAEASRTETLAIHKPWAEMIVYGLGRWWACDSRFLVGGARVLRIVVWGTAGKGFVPFQERPWARREFGPSRAWGCDSDTSRFEITPLRLGWFGSGHEEWVENGAKVVAVLGFRGRVRVVTGLGVSGRLRGSTDSTILKIRDSLNTVKATPRPKPRHSVPARRLPRGDSAILMPPPSSFPQRGIKPSDSSDVVPKSRLSLDVDPELMSSPGSVGLSTSSKTHVEHATEVCWSPGCDPARRWGEVLFVILFRGFPNRLPPPAERRLQESIQK